MFAQYPYLNLNDFNLDYILKAIKDMRYEVTNFVSINAIKYADPIQWNITSQYEKNTIVIDPVTGTAYISVAPVPVGVALTRPEYWTVVFDLQSFVTKANQNLANNYEEQTTTTATMNTAEGAWVIWGDVLYKALVNITAGDAYVVGSNIQRIVIEDVINALLQDIADEAQTRLDADAAIVNIIGDLNDLNTTDKTSIVNAINDEVQARQDADDAIDNTIGDLNDLNTGDKSSVVNAINDEVQARQDADAVIDGYIGDLDDLDTTDKSSLVAAINELYNTPSGGEAFWHNVKDEFGAVGDGVTDDTQAIKTALAYMQTNRVGLYFPEGEYRITENWTLDDTNNRWFVIRGAHRARTVIRADIASGYLFDLTSSGTFRYCEISELTFYNADATLPINAFRIYRMSHSVMHDLIFRNFDTSIDAEMCWCMLIYNCEFREHSTGGAHSHMVLSYQCNVWNVISCQFAGRTDAVMYGITLARAQTTINIQQCTFDHALGIQLTHNTTDTAPLANINIDNCYFEHMQGLSVRCNIASAGYIKNVTIKNCYLNAIEDGNIAYAIDPRYTSAITIRDNYCVRYTTAMVSADAQGKFNDEYELINNITDGVAVFRSPAHEVKGSASAAPLSGYHHIGEIVYNNAPSATNYGWLCTTAGTPGTWIAINPS